MVERPRQRPFGTVARLRFGPVHSHFLGLRGSRLVRLLRGHVSATEAAGARVRGRIHPPGRRGRAYQSQRCLSAPGYEGHQLREPVDEIFLGP